MQEDSVAYYLYKLLIMRDVYGVLRIKQHLQYFYIQVDECGVILFESLSQNC